jgi:hypothetical protein
MHHINSFADILKTVDFDLCVPHVGEFTELYLHFYFQNKTTLVELVYRLQGTWVYSCVFTNVL